MRKDARRVLWPGVPQATFDYLAGLEWLGAAEDVVLVGPAGTGKPEAQLQDSIDRNRGDPRAPRSVTAYLELADHPLTAERGQRDVRRVFLEAEAPL